MAHSIVFCLCTFNKKSMHVTLKGCWTNKVVCAVHLLSQHSTICMYCALFRSVLSVCSISFPHALQCGHLVLQCPCSLYMGCNSETLVRVTFISLSESPEVKDSFGLFQNRLCLGVTYLQFYGDAQRLVTFVCSVSCGICGLSCK